MKNIKPFGPSIGKGRLSKKFINKLNNEFDFKSNSKKIDYSSKLASQINTWWMFLKKYIYFHYFGHCSSSRPCLVVPIHV